MQGTYRGHGVTSAECAGRTGLACCVKGADLGNNRCVTSPAREAARPKQSQVSFPHGMNAPVVIPPCLHHLVPRVHGRAEEPPWGADALRKTRETLLFLFPHRRRTFTRRRTACSLSPSSSSSHRPPPSCRPHATWPTTVSFWGEAKQNHRCDGWTVTHVRRLILLTGWNLT